MNTRLTTFLFRLLFGQAAFICVLAFSVSAAAAEIAESPVRETYFPEFDMYEAGLADDTYFYTNVRNGDITDKIVKFDFPDGVGVAMEKDGEPEAFINRSMIAEAGSYSLRITYGNYYSVFRFRIQSRPETPTPNISGDDTLDGTLGLIVEAAAEPTDAEQQKLADVNVYTGLHEEYDPDNRRFLYRMQAGDVIESSVPNGIVTNSPVTLNIPEGIVAAVTRDDSAYVLESDAPISDPGSYHCVFSNPGVDYPALSGKLDFRIVAGDVNDLRLYYPPQGFAVADVKKDAETYAFSPSRVMFADNGRYEVGLAADFNQNLTYDFSFTLDTQPPVFTLDNVAGGQSVAPEVYVNYISEDIDRVEFWLDGVRLENFDRRTIKDSGTYVIKVYDRAGNMSVQEFEMNYKMNTAAIFVVLAVVLLLAGGVFFFNYVKRSTRAS